MADVDGRLDLDDLGRVIEHASTLDRARPGDQTDLDVLEGASGPQVGDLLDRWGVTPWLRRHRVLVASVAVAAIAVTLTTGTLLAHRLPDDDGRLHLAVTDNAATNQTGLIGGDATTAVAVAGYDVVPDRAGDTGALVGVTGPGIRSSSAHPSATIVGARPIWTVGAVIGCDDPASSTSSVSQYQLVARRTDAFGRVVQTSIPLPGGTQWRWDQYVHSYCLQAQVLSRLRLESVSANLSRDLSSMEIRLGVRSSLDHDVIITSSSWAGQAVRAAGMSKLLRAGQTTPVVVPFTFADCSHPSLEPVSISPADEPDSVVANDRGLAFEVTDALDAPSNATWTAVWSHAVGVQVSRQMARACQGVPAATLRTVAALRASDADVEAARALRGDPNGTALRVRFDVATTSPGVRISDIFSTYDIGTGASPSVTTGTAVTHGGHARVDVLWSTSCDPSSSPAILQVHLTRGAREYAVMSTVNDAALLSGLLAACPALLPEMLTTNGTGWGAPSP